jgi:hypothetical protein
MDLSESVKDVEKHLTKTETEEIRSIASSLLQIPTIQTGQILHSVMGIYSHSKVFRAFHPRTHIHISHQQSLRLTVNEYCVLNILQLTHSQPFMLHSLNWRWAERRRHSPPLSTHTRTTGHTLLPYTLHDRHHHFSQTVNGLRLILSTITYVIYAHSGRD